MQGLLQTVVRTMINSAVAWMVFLNGVNTLLQYSFLPLNGSKYYLKYKFTAVHVLVILNPGTCVIFKVSMGAWEIELLSCNLRNIVADSFPRRGKLSFIQRKLHLFIVKEIDMNSKMELQCYWFPSTMNSSSIALSYGWIAYSFITRRHIFRFGIFVVVQINIVLTIPYPI